MEMQVSEEPQLMTVSNRDMAICLMVNVACLLEQGSSVLWRWHKEFQLVMMRPNKTKSKAPAFVCLAEECTLLTIHAGMGGLC